MSDGNINVFLSIFPFPTHLAAASASTQGDRGWRTGFRVMHLLPKPQNSVRIRPVAAAHVAPWPEYNETVTPEPLHIL